MRQFAQGRMTRFPYWYIHLWRQYQRVLFAILTTAGILDKGFGIIHVLHNRYLILGFVTLFEFSSTKTFGTEKPVILSYLISTFQNSQTRTRVPLPTVLRTRINFLLHCTFSFNFLRFLYTGLFISPSGISEFDCATTKTDTAERSTSIGRESLQVFLYYGPWRTSRFHR